MRSSIHPIHAETRDLRGTIDGEVTAEGPNLDAPHRAELELPVDSLKTGNALEDREMLRRMDVRRFPTIKVVVTEVKRIEGSPERCVGTVQVTALGQSRTFEAEFKLRSNGESVNIDGEHSFDMRDFGLVPPKLLMFKMEPDVKIRARIVAKQAAAP
jgi:polyisoprenoid-binding protein YceI